MGELKLGLPLGYWSGEPPRSFVELLQQAERLGYDCVRTAEAYGFDALTRRAWIGAQTERIRLGTGVRQLSARTPTTLYVGGMGANDRTRDRLQAWRQTPVTSPLVPAPSSAELVPGSD